MSSDSLRLVTVHNRADLRQLFLCNPALYVYELGDLDDFYFENTIYYGLRDNETSTLKAAILQYVAEPPAVILAMDDGSNPLQKELLKRILPFLSHRIYIHAPQSLVDEFSAFYDVTLHHGPHYRMYLTDSSHIMSTNVESTIALGPEDVDEISIFYRNHYPGNFFDPNMLKTNMYFGMRSLGATGELIAIAGVHSFSSTYNVAALGNVAVHSEHRRKGLSKIVVSKLCQELIKVGVIDIGLNAKESNEVAIRSYTALGFAITTSFMEIEMVRKPI